MALHCYCNAEETLLWELLHYWRPYQVMKLIFFSDQLHNFVELALIKENRIIVITVSVEQLNIDFIFYRIIFHSCFVTVKEISSSWILFKPIA